MATKTVQCRWAVGERIDRARPVSRIEQKDATNEVVWVPTGRLMALMEPSQRESVDPQKIAAAIAFWNDGGFMEPPVVSVYDRHIVYADGRARVLAARQSGVPHIPVVIPVSETDTLKILTGSASSRQPLVSGV